MAAQPLAWAKDDGTARKLLDEVLRQMQVFRTAPAPFVLEVEFTAQTTTQVRGHVKVRWESKDRSWTWVDFGDFQQVRVHSGGEEYEARNINFRPIRVSQVFGQLHLNEDPAAMKAQKEKKRTEKGSQLDCVQVQKLDWGKQVNELCVDASTRDLVSISWKDDENISYVQRYSGYAESEGRRYPTRMEMAVGNVTLLSVTIKNFKSAPFDAALLKPPKGPIERRRCDGQKPPVLIEKTEINVPNQSGRPASNTLAMVALTVQTDGTEGDANLLEMGNKVLDDTVVATVKNWKFKPAMCGDEPVIADLTVEVAFKIIP